MKHGRAEIRGFTCCWAPSMTIRSRATCDFFLHLGSRLMPTVFPTRHGIANVQGSSARRARGDTNGHRWTSKWCPRRYGQVKVSKGVSTRVSGAEWPKNQVNVARMDPEPFCDSRRLWYTSTNKFSAQQGWQHGVRSRSLGYALSNPSIADAQAGTARYFTIKAPRGRIPFSLVSLWPAKSKNP
jgi:hypothetical protein